MHAGRRGGRPCPVPVPTLVARGLALFALEPQLPAVRGDAEPRERGGRERDEGAWSRPGRRRRVGVGVRRGPVSPAGEGDRVVDQRQAARVRGGVVVAAAAHGRLEADAGQTKVQLETRQRLNGR